MERSKLKRYIVGGGTFATALAIGFVFQYGDAVAARLGVAGPANEAAQSEDTGQALVPVTASIAVPNDLSAPVANTIETSEIALGTITNDQETPTVAFSEAAVPDLLSDMTLPSIDETTDLEETIDDMPPAVTELAEPEYEVATVEIDLEPKPADSIGVTLEMSEAKPDSAVDLPAEAEPNAVAALASQVNNTANASVDADVAIDMVDTASCDIGAFALALEGAIVELNLDAPCHMNESFVISHEGVTVMGMTDDLGLAQVSLPALSKDASFSMEFAEGETATAKALVPNIADYSRTVLHWEGAAGFQLHAFHNGSDYGSDGHVWKGSAEGKSAFFSADAKGGSIEIYTVPVSDVDTVAMTIEAEVNADNCGRLVKAEAMQFDAIQLLTRADLELHMPDCDAIGEYLVLKNMFEGLTLAAK